MSAPAATICVLIVDDHPLMRVGVAAILNAQPDMKVVAQAGLAREAVACGLTLHSWICVCRQERRRGDSANPRHRRACTSHRTYDVRGR